MLKQLFCGFLLCWFLAGTGFVWGQDAPSISGDINFRLKYNTDRSDEVWTRGTLRLKIDSTVGSNARAFAAIKAYTGDTVSFFNLNEAYVEYYGKHWDLKGGLQVFSWGTAYELNPTNNLSPYDLSEEANFIPEDRLGVPAVRLRYYPFFLSKLTLTGVYVPYFVPAMLPAGMPLPGRTNANSEYAFKLGASSILGSDFSISYFRSRDDIPWVTGMVGPIPVVEYPEIRIYGVDFITTIGDVALWAEAGFTDPVDITKSDTAYSWTIGGECTFFDDLYLLVQLYQRNTTKNVLNNTLNTQENLGMLVLRYPFQDVHILRVAVGYQFDNQITIVLPEVTFSLADATSLKIGGICVAGDVAASALLSQIKGKAFAELKYCF